MYEGYRRGVLGVSGGFIRGVLGVCQGCIRGALPSMSVGVG